MPNPYGPKAPSSRRTAPHPVRVLLANDSRISCQSLKDSLERCSRKCRVRVVGYAVTRADVMAVLSKGSTDVVLINDEFQDGRDAFYQTLRSIHQEFSQTKLVVLLKHPDAASVIAAFRGGVRGVFHRSETIEALCKCVRAVHEGQIWANSQDLGYIVESLAMPPVSPGSDSNGIALLTKRENEAARLVAEGHTNRAIAEKLGLTEHTVSNYLFRICNKLGISNRVELVLYAFNQKRDG